MAKLTGHATATGTGRTALASTGNPTTAPMTAAGGTPQASMMTGPMTGGSPATSSTHGRRATARPGSMSAGKHGTDTPATSRAWMETAGCTGTTPGSTNTGSTLTGGGSPSASEHWISQGLRQQIMKWLRSHAISPV